MYCEWSDLVYRSTSERHTFCMRCVYVKHQMNWYWKCISIFFLAALARAMFFIRCFDLFLFIFLLILLFIFLYKQKKKQNSRLVRFGRWVGHTQCIWSSSLLSAVLSDYFDIWTDFMYIIIIFALFYFHFILFSNRLYGGLAIL